MRRKLLFWLTLPLLVLVALFAVIAFDLPPFRQDAALLEVSVLIRESDSTPWAAARQGMEQAAADLGVELRFLSLSEDNNVEEQRTLLAREVEGGADSILLVPADPEALADDVKQAASKTTVLSLESDLSASGAKACVSVDNAALGEVLGRAVLNGVPAGGEVVLINSAPGSTGVMNRLEAAAQVLEQEGRQVSYCLADENHTLAEALTLALSVRQPGAVVAFESSALELAARLSQSAPQRPLVYGMGSTPAVTAGLEQSHITAIAAQNEFAMGYLSVEAAVEAIRRNTVTVAAPLGFSLVRQENMYEPDNQKLLFPVTW